MVVERIVIKNYGEVDSLELVPSIGANEVKREVASAIALLTRNFYAQRALDIISPVEDT